MGRSGSGRRSGTRRRTGPGRKARARERGHARVAMHGSRRPQSARKKRQIVRVGCRGPSEDTILGRRREGVGRALQRALGTQFVLPEVEPREGGTSLLMNPRRQRVFEYVWNHPCAHLRRMSRELHVPPQSLRWHLLRLTEAGLLASRPVKGKTVYFAPWALRDEDVALFASLSNGMRGRIVRLVAQ